MMNNDLFAAWKETYNVMHISHKNGVQVFISPLGDKKKSHLQVSRLFY